MTENSKLEDMDCDSFSSNCEARELGENGGRKISVSDHVNGLQHSTSKTDSFVVDVERFSHLIERDTNANSRIKLQRNLSRKGCGRIGERKITSNDRDISLLATSPRATFHGGSMPEKATVVGVGATDQSSSPQLHHHQITISNGSLSSTVAAPETKSLGRKFSFRRSNSPAWTIDPRRILFFFATISCMGTILLIYFTLSMGKLNGDENALN